MGLHRDEFISDQEIVDRIASARLAEKDRDVEIPLGKVDEVGPDAQLEVNIGMLLGEFRKPRSEPAGTEGRQGYECEIAALLLACTQPSGGGLDLIETVAYRLEVLAARFGERDPLLRAKEQLATEFFFQRPDVPTNGTLCQVQLNRSAREARESCSTFKSLQHTERGDVSSHKTMTS